MGNLENEKGKEQTGNERGDEKGFVLRQKEYARLGTV